MIDRGRTPLRNFLKMDAQKAELVTSLHSLNDTKMLGINTSYMDDIAKVYL